MKNIKRHDAKTLAQPLCHGKQQIEKIDEALTFGIWEGLMKFTMLTNIPSKSKGVHIYCSIRTIMMSMGK